MFQDPSDVILWALVISLGLVILYLTVDWIFVSFLEDLALLRAIRSGQYVVNIKTEDEGTRVQLESGYQKAVPKKAAAEKAHEMQEA